MNVYCRTQKEGSKPLIEVIYNEKLWFPPSVCFQFSIRMVANLTHPERDFFEKLAIIISVLLMCLTCDGSGCEG